MLAMLHWTRSSTQAQIMLQGRAELSVGDAGMYGLETGPLGTTQSTRPVQLHSKEDQLTSLDCQIGRLSVMIRTAVNGVPWVPAPGRAPAMPRRLRDNDLCPRGRAGPQGKRDSVSVTRKA